MINADKAIEMAGVKDKVKTSLEGEEGVLESEIKLDEVNKISVN